MLRLRLLGSFHLLRDNPVTLRNRKAQALIAYLALSSATLSRERLATILWPDSSEEAARQSLRQCLSGLRRELVDLPIVAEGDSVRMSADLVTVDVHDFEAAIGDPSVENLNEAARLYSGNLLEGFDARSDAFDEWLLIERTRLKALATSALGILLQELQAQGRRDDAIALALRLLAIEPLQEEVYRTLMRLYLRSGQTALALRQYTRCETVLRKELDIEPDQETKALKQEALRQRSRRAPSTLVRKSASFSESELQQSIGTCVAKDGVRIAYATSGTGQPLVKAANWLNHLEFDFSSPVWRHWIETFSADHAFLRYDERGTGLSDWDVFDFSFDSFVRDLETVVDAAGLDRFPLLGISQGCAISIAYAARHPERVSKLILYGGYAKGWVHQADPAEIARRQALSTLVLEGWGQEDPLFRQLFTSLFIPEANTEQTQWFNDLQRTTTSPANAYRLANIFGEIDVRAILPEVRAPTLVLHARGDARVRFSEGQELGAMISGAEFVALDSRNHILLADEPAWSQFRDRTLAFLRS